VEAPAVTLETLVRDELRGPVGELVRKVVVELVHEQLNGSGPAARINGKAPEKPQDATPSEGVRHAGDGREAENEKVHRLR
jgi:hypothetical protein